MNSTLSKGRRFGCRGFTLVELMIVVVILGIIAAIIIAMVNFSSADAKRAAAQDSARLAAQAVQLYKEQTGRLPNLVGANWAPLTTQTTVNGVTVGPFLSAVPVNPLSTANPSSVNDGMGNAYTDVCAFLYDYSGGFGTGQLVASLDPTPATGP